MSAETSIGRKPHESKNLSSRNLKALKIERLLALAEPGSSIRMLEIGTGSGGIAHYFGTHPKLRCEVDAVDVHDNRLVSEGYRYQTVRDTQLPFADTVFDVVLSNHVIEHVGDEEAQRMHLAELHRVLRPDGVGYLAVPNRWMLVEPHYRLAFLSWLPSSWRTPYLRLRGRGTNYDCKPLTTRELEPALRETGFDFVQQHGRALRLTYEMERPRTFTYLWLLKWMPDVVYGLARRIFPTLIYVIRPRPVQSPTDVLPLDEVDGETRAP